ncbi:hypothetical protein HID58_091963 [Brassica napus]|uniref:Uncharacterized protein n=1 Tax=Brassica napus TaxID=3708 RepID=A0ABQ7WY17_BRANA|nr:hypothetical protein HID58_091963 [Brassica napus]
MVIGVCAWLAQEDNASSVDLEQHQKQALGVRTNGLRFMDPDKKILRRSGCRKVMNQLTSKMLAKGHISTPTKEEEAIQAMNKPQESDDTAKTMKDDQGVRARREGGCRVMIVLQVFILVQQGKEPTNETRIKPLWIQGK